MKTKLSQVVVYVSDMRESTAFYRDILGLKPVSESDQWSELAAGTFHIALHLGKRGDEVSGEVGIPAGRAELIFEVDDIDKASAEIQQKGGAVEGPMMMDGINVRVAFLRDPDGMSIELMEAR